MPYVTKGKCVYRKDTGKKIGCTKGSVKKYLAALHANVKDINESTAGKYDFLKNNNLIGFKIKAGDTIMTITKINPYTSKDRIITITSENPFYNSEDIGSEKMFNADILESDLINTLNSGKWSIDSNEDPFEKLNESEEWYNEILNKKPLIRFDDLMIGDIISNIDPEHKQPDTYLHVLSFEDGETWRNAYQEPEKYVICNLVKEDSDTSNFIPISRADLKFPRGKNIPMWTLIYREGVVESINESEDGLEWVEDTVSDSSVIDNLLSYKGKEVIIDVEALNANEMVRLYEILEPYVVITRDLIPTDDGGEVYWTNDCFHPNWGNLTGSQRIGVVSLHCGIEDNDYDPVKGLVCCLPTVENALSTLEEGSYIQVDGRTLLSMAENRNINESEEEDELYWAEDLFKSVDEGIDITGRQESLFDLLPNNILRITGEQDFLRLKNQEVQFIKYNNDKPNYYALVKLPHIMENDEEELTHCGHTDTYNICECDRTDGEVGKCWWIQLDQMDNITLLPNRIYPDSNINESEDLEWAEDTVNTNPTYRFSDLIFKPHHVIPGAVKARLNFPNGHYISVVGGPHLYGDGIDTFEIWRSDQEDVQGYLSKGDVTREMLELQTLPPLEGEGTFVKEPITESDDFEWAEEAIGGLEYSESYKGQDLPDGTMLTIDGYWEELYFDDIEAKVIRKSDDGYSMYLLSFPQVIENDWITTHCGDYENENDNDRRECHCKGDSEIGRCWWVNLDDLNEIGEVKILPNRKYFMNENKKPLLVEGRYDSITRKTVKDIMSKIVETKGSTEPYELELPNDINPEEYEYSKDSINFSVLLNLKREKPQNGKTFSVTTSLSPDDEMGENLIFVTVEIDPTQEPQVYQKIFFKLQEDIRHEIEHLTQIGVPTTSNLKTVYGHHKNKFEVPALVHGFYRRAKLERKPLDEIMIEDLDSEIERSFLA